MWERICTPQRIQESQEGEQMWYHTQESTGGLGFNPNNPLAQPLRFECCYIEVVCPMSFEG